MPSFNDFNLQPATHAALANMEITEPTPIQAEAIPALLAGNDLVGQSATGSGKTLAYGVPLVERLARDKRVVQALVLLPTRELAVQVHAVLGTLASSRRLTTALLVGGRPYANQISALRYGSQIVVGTPGRVKDHLDRGNLVLSELRVCVLDEADQMLDIGFAPAIEEILTTTPDTRQTALFSATIPDWVAQLEKKFLKNPVKIDAMDAQSTIEQIAYQVPQEQKMAALCTLLQSAEGESSLIFGRTKYGVEKLGKQLSKLGFTVGTLHGNKSQRAREEVLTAFRRGHVQTLLATNVAARGLDIHGIYQVINYELPESSDLFTHRIGRTGRMGRQGKAITLLAPSDLPKWRIMARSLGQVVALQRLVIDEEAIGTMPLARPEAPVTQEHEQNNEQRPGRD
ncbi:MAG TPA: DEAD/DEAH box helicase, partial [Ktedonobacteraceae bacterium]